MDEAVSDRPKRRFAGIQAWTRQHPAKARLVATAFVAILIGAPVVWQIKQLTQGKLELQRQAERSSINAQLFRAAELINHRPADAEQILSRTPDGLRDLAWGILQHRLRKKSLQLSGHRDVVADLAFSPDANALASVDSSGTIKLWDTKTGTEQKTLFQTEYEITWLEVHDSDDPHLLAAKRLGSFEPVSPLRFSVNGRFLAVLLKPASADWNVRKPATLFLFDLSSESPPTRFEDVTDFVFSSRDSLLAFCSKGTIRLWWPETSKDRPISVPEDFGTVMDLKFRPDGISLVAASSLNKLIEFVPEGDDMSLKLLGQVEGFQDSKCSLSPGATRLAVLGTMAPEQTTNKTQTASQPFLAVYDDRLNVVAKLAVKNPVNQAVQWISDDRHLILNSDSSERLLQVQENEFKTVATLNGNESRLGLTGRLTDGAVVQTNLDQYGPNRKLTLQVRDSNKETQLLSWYPREIARENTTVISANEKLVATADASRRIHLWHLGDINEIVWNNAEHTSRIIGLQFSKDGSHFCTLDQDHKVALWDLAKGQVSSRCDLPDKFENWYVRLHAESARIMVFPTFRRNGRTYLTPKECYVRDIVTNQNIFSGAAIEGVFQWQLDEAPYLTDDGKSFVMSLTGNILQIWDIDSSKERYKISVPGNLQNSVQSDRGSLLTLAKENEQWVLREWDISDGRPVGSHTLRGVPGSLTNSIYVRKTSNNFRYIEMEIDTIRYWSDLQDGTLTRADFVTPNGEWCLIDFRERQLSTFTPFGALATVPLATDGAIFTWAGSTMMSVNADSTVSLWDAGRGEEQLRLKTGAKKVGAVLPSPAQNAVILTDEAGGVAIIRAVAPE